ncbi:hypothetical protein [Streptomyces sp. H27-D2]|uniref:hypothetical protein n=1 Tax=Streptomyces sp. H27-D2 TaxID=3046304 RepID=UPI002DBCA3B5|nr:hypothetical protein [Streptomyces sp. H27-D2]MEC4016503.1 hypothetical protein [Streptomyces sp. H27-D2]
MTRGRRIAVILALTAATAGICQPAAYAGREGGQKRGSTKGETLTASVTETKIKISRSGGKSGSTGLTSTNGNWTPPVCWYEPVATPKQLKSSVEKMDAYSDFIPVAPGLEWGQITFEKYLAKKSELTKYDDYAVPQEGKGMWYRGVINPNREDEAEVDSCSNILFFVPDGAKPKAPEMVSPEILAGYAYDEIRVPDTKAKMKPDGKQTVNLPTWIWLDKAKFQPVKAKATLPGTGLWAETTATPVSLHIDPGTKDAKAFPTSGDCPINKDGSIGTPYAKGKANQDPPCGVSYLRATTNTPPHKLKATLTWEISWKGSGDTGDTLPNGTFGTTTDVTVQEHQAVNR